MRETERFRWKRESSIWKPPRVPNLFTISTNHPWNTALSTMLNERRRQLTEQSSIIRHTTGHFRDVSFWATNCTGNNYKRKTGIKYDCLILFHPHHSDVGALVFNHCTMALGETLQTRQTSRCWSATSSLPKFFNELELKNVNRQYI